MTDRIAAARKWLAAQLQTEAAMTPGPWFGGWSGPNHKGVTGSTCVSTRWDFDCHAEDTMFCGGDPGKPWPFTIVSYEMPYDADGDDGKPCVDYYGHTICVVPDVEPGDTGTLGANAAGIAASRNQWRALLLIADGELHYHAAHLHDPRTSEYNAHEAHLNDILARLREAGYTEAEHD